MPQTTTLLQLRTQARQRADQENSTFVADAELNSIINYELGDLYDILVNAYEDYFVSVDTSTTLVAGTESYNLPSDFYKLLKVFFKEGTNRYALRRFHFEEFDFDYENYGTTASTNRYLRYRILGSKIYFIPLPSSGGTIEIFYVPELTRLSADGDAITFNVPTQGWDQYIIAGAAARMMIKEESDPSPLLAEQARIKDNIIHSARDRDSGEPHRVGDVYGRFEPWSGRL